MEQALSRKCNAFFPGYGAEVVEEWVMAGFNAATGLKRK
jgi:hypothetical protein